MNWTMPGQPDNPTQKEFWNTDEGMRALFQNMSDFFSNGGQNSAMAGWFNNLFGAESNRYKAEAIQNKDLDFGQYLQQRSPQYMALFNALPATLRGSQPGFMRRGRDLW